MNTELLYELYEITEKNDAPDLATVGMPMLLKKHPEITHEEAREMREFTGRHGQELAAAYPDKEAFAAAVAVQRIPDAHCNGDMHAALEYARKVKHAQKDFLTEQGVKAIY